MWILGLIAMLTATSALAANDLPPFCGNNTNFGAAKLVQPYTPVYQKLAKHKKHGHLAMNDLKVATWFADQAEARRKKYCAFVDQLAHRIPAGVKAQEQCADQTEAAEKFTAGITAYRAMLEEVWDAYEDIVKAWAYATANSKFRELETSLRKEKIDPAPLDPEEEYLFTESSSVKRKPQYSLIKHYAVSVGAENNALFHACTDLEKHRDQAKENAARLGCTVPKEIMKVTCARGKAEAT
jgi:hypothetical protein